MEPDDEGDLFADAVLTAIERDWELFGLQRPAVLKAWSIGRRFLIVFRPLPRTRPEEIYGVDWLIDESPTGMTDATMTERATEVARYVILEPRETGRDASVSPSSISWVTNVENGDRPATLDLM